MEYQVTSFGESRKGGQITVTVGEGRNRRSFTRHINNSRVGLNIDERAIPLNALYESELATAKAQLASADAVLKNLEKELKAAEKAEPMSASETGIIAAFKMVAQSGIQIAKEILVAATQAVVEAENKLNIVRRELPLMMEFCRS